MRQIFLSRSGTVRLEHVPAPGRGSAEVLVDVEASLLTQDPPAGGSRARGEERDMLAGVTKLIRAWRDAGAYCAWQYSRSRRRVLTPPGWCVAGRVAEADEPSLI